MDRIVILLITATLSVASTSFSNNIVYEDGFIADVNYDARETSLTSLELQKVEEGFVADVNYDFQEPFLTSKELHQVEDGFVVDINYDIHEPSPISQEPRQLLAESKSRVTRDLQHHPYAHRMPPNSENAHIIPVRIVKRDISDIEVDIEVSHLQDKNGEDPIADTSTEEHLDSKYNYEVPASEWHNQDESLEGHNEEKSHEEPVAEWHHQDESLEGHNEEKSHEEPVAEWHHQDESLEGHNKEKSHEEPVAEWHHQDGSLEDHYKQDSHEEPIEERTHGVRARQPRDEEEERFDQDDAKDVPNLRDEEPEEDRAYVDDGDTFNQAKEEPAEDKNYVEEDTQPRAKKEADFDGSSSQVTSKRITRQSANDYEKHLQSKMEQKKRDITSALAEDYLGQYTMAELEAAVVTALNEYYGQKIVNRLKRAAYMDLDYENSHQKKKTHSKKNMILK